MWSPRIVFLMEGWESKTTTMSPSSEAVKHRGRTAEDTKSLTKFRDAPEYVTVSPPFICEDHAWETKAGRGQCYMSAQIYVFDNYLFFGEIMKI